MSTDLTDDNGFNLYEDPDAENPRHVYNGSVDAELRAARTDALTFLNRGDFRNARIRANGALLILGTIPDGGLGGLANQAWNRQSIVMFIEQLDRLEASSLNEESGGMLLQSFQYTGRRSC